MVRFYRSVLILSILGAFLSSISCDKIKEEITEEYEVSFYDVKDVAVSEANANVAYADLFFTALKANEEVVNSLGGTGVAKTESANGEYPIVLFWWEKNGTDPFAKYYFSVDFGPENVLGEDGFYRRGGLTYECTGKWGDIGSKIAVTTKLLDANMNVINDSFYLNDNKVEGELVYTTWGENNYYRELKNGKITNPESGASATRNSTINIKWTAGFETKGDFSDDSYEFFGKIDGVTANSVEYAVTIPEDAPIVKSATCTFPISGINTLKIKNWEFDLDFTFDNSNCDRKALINFYGVEKEITF